MKGYKGERSYKEGMSDVGGRRGGRRDRKKEDSRRKV